MTEFLQKLSAILFYLLGLTVFGAYLLLRKELYAPWPLWWLTITDLPLLLTGLLYGSTSLYLSLQSASKPSLSLVFFIFVPALLLFVLFTVLNFWPILI
ncbi:hypothetical protein COU77_03340 [Candidatus Peregrinibacteria bacterium CG10_big_fil_rev_8_21_14_0_10_49_16]|nr:MAG: hypothetical protein COW95_01320 [Candidatus Peregrinibacteria bacterium CG22_combo_CG10-13_8_21_14_all_49_11]PIR51883.1 MAG: hypothetical protein COU77_03340 [Candidatus Peregrinibacteria bacterium CG10_big_fil_rev_8_21_14_0_10_49_16]